MMKKLVGVIFSGVVFALCAIQVMAASVEGVGFTSPLWSVPDYGVDAVVAFRDLVNGSRCSSVAQCSSKQRVEIIGQMCKYQTDCPGSANPDEIYVCKNGMCTLEPM